jgi:hypothetical protein
VRLFGKAQGKGAFELRDFCGEALSPLTGSSEGTYPGVQIFKASSLEVPML